MEVGLFTSAECGMSLDRQRTVSPSHRLRNLVEEITLADQVGLEARAQSALGRRSTTHVSAPSRPTAR